MLGVGVPRKARAAADHHHGVADAHLRVDACQPTPCRANSSRAPNTVFTKSIISAACGTVTYGVMV
jgi:hypothetical protein